MKKLLSLISASLIAVSLSVFAAAAGHTSADQVFGSDGKTDIAAVGQNDETNTALGKITEDKITLFGWYADEQKIAEFGYRYGDNVTLGSAKYEGPDAAGIAEQAGKLGYANGESARFRISDIPVVKGENVELYAVAKLENGDTVDIWRLTYSSDNGIEMPGSSSTPQNGSGTQNGNGAGSTPNNAQNPQTADASVIAAVSLAVLALGGSAVIRRIR